MLVLLILNRHLLQSLQIIESNLFTIRTVYIQVLVQRLHVLLVIVVPSKLADWLINAGVVSPMTFEFNVSFVIIVIFIFEKGSENVFSGQRIGLNGVVSNINEVRFSFCDDIEITNELGANLMVSYLVWVENISVRADTNSYFTFTYKVHFCNFLIFFVDDSVISC